ncbi:hypothetical protein DAT35_36460 [Vitiosangium sp. GDMCC 1.1324]|nr:hypothetical protein DAT35_36460 [Vitiosangium sp. GDMCC 1.1324]
MSQIDIGKSKEVLARYRETLDSVRNAEMLAQLNPGEFHGDELASLKRARQALNDTTLVVAEQEAHVASVEQLRRELDDLEDGERSSTRKYKRLVFYWNILLTMLALSLVSSIRKSGIVPWFIIYVASGGLVARCVGVSVALASGVGLYWLRKRSRRLYAALELGFALMAAWTSLGYSTLLNETTKQVSIIGAIYLIVRALDNFAQGQKAVEELHKRRVNLAALRSRKASTVGSLVRPPTES